MMSIQEQDELNRRRRLQQQQEMAGIMRGMLQNAKNSTVQAHLTKKPGEKPEEAPEVPINAPESLNPADFTPEGTPIPKGNADPGMLEDLLRRFRGG